MATGISVPVDEVLKNIVCLSDNIGSFDCFNPLEFGDIFEAEVFDTRLKTKYLSVWHLHAAAQVLNIPIVSLYPDNKGQESLRSLLDRTFKPFGFSSLDDENFTILWTSAREDMASDYWLANHVVPMVKAFKGVPIIKAYRV